MKLGMLFQKGFSAGTATSLTLLGSLEEFFFFLLSIPILFLFSSIFNFPIDLHPLVQFKTRISNSPILIFILLGFILIWILFKNSYLKRDTKGRLKKAIESVKKLINDFIAVYRLIIKRGKSRFLLTLFLASIHWTARFSIIFTILSGFEITFNPLQLFLFQWVVFTLMMLTPTPGSVGGAEASFYFVYGAFIPDSMLGLVTAGWRLLTYYFQLTLASILFSLLYYKTFEKGPGY